MDIVNENFIRDWHLSRGGHGTRAAGHAVRILRECIELCIAAGASWQEVTGAIGAELNKADRRGEWDNDHSYEEALEEFADVSILMTVFRGYFIKPGDDEKAINEKMHVVIGRDWEADADGVLWRPGTRGLPGTPGTDERS